MTARAADLVRWETRRKGNSGDERAGKARRTRRLADMEQAGAWGSADDKRRGKGRDVKDANPFKKCLSGRLNPAPAAGMSR